MAGAGSVARSIDAGAQTYSVQQRRLITPPCRALRASRNQWRLAASKAWHLMARHRKQRKHRARQQQRKKKIVSARHRQAKRRKASIIEGKAAATRLVAARSKKQQRGKRRCIVGAARCVAPASISS